MDTKTITLADGRTVLARADAKFTLHRRRPDAERRDAAGVPARPREPNHLQWSIESGSVGHYWAKPTTRLSGRDW